MSIKLFVGNLGADVTEGDLRDAFAAHAPVTGMRLILDPLGKSRGFGFVIFNSPKEAQAAMRAMFRGTLKGRRLIVNEALMPDEWYEQPMHDLGLDEGKWKVVIPAFEKILAERNLLKPGDNPTLQALLMYVMDHGSIPRLEKVLAAGANPNMVMTRGETPLGKAANSGHGREFSAEAFRLLLAAGADPNIPSEHNSVLAIAKKRGQAEIIVMLRGALGEQKVSKNDLDFALGMAAGEGLLQMVQRLLAEGVPPDPEPGPWSPAFTPLMSAAFGGHAEIVKVLLAAGADVNRKNLEGSTALDAARKNRAVACEVIPLLLKAGAESGQPSGDGKESAHGFIAAAMKAPYRRAVAKAKRLTGATRRRLRAAGGEEIPGGYGFVIAEDGARAIVEEHHYEFLSLGAYVFFTQDLTDVNGSVVALLPTTDVYRVITAVGTQGPNSEVYNADLLKWLRILEKEQPFVIFGIGRDFIEGKFTKEIKDPLTLVRRINKLCPDGDDSPEAEMCEADGLQRTRQLFLWWD